MGSIPMSGSRFRVLIWSSTIKGLQGFYRPWWDFHNAVDQAVKLERRAIWKESGFQDVDSSEDLETG